MKLSDREWREFYITDVFEINPGKRLTKKEMTAGDMPFVGATESNNGITNYVANVNNSMDSNVLGVNYNGSVVETFYHPYKCIFSDDVKRFSLKDIHGNKYVYLFFKSIILKQKPKYTYGYKFNENRMKRQLIMVPVDKNKEPDYVFMESYIKHLLNASIGRYRDFVKDNISRLKKKDIVSLEEKEWEEFCIEELFNVSIGKNVDGNKVDKEFGKTAYITRKESNNGLDGFIDNDVQKLNSKFPVITIGNETAQPFVQNYPFYTGTKVNILEPIDDVSDKVLQFIATSLQQHKTKYNYSYTINSTRLKKQKILLPVNDNKKPDYEYMEQYISNLMIDKYEDYLSYQNQ